VRQHGIRSGCRGSGDVASADPTTGTRVGQYRDATRAPRRNLRTTYELAAGACNAAAATVWLKRFQPDCRWLACGTIKLNNPK
jgi:hypothetical protein